MKLNSIISKNANNNINIEEMKKLMAENERYIVITDDKYFAQDFKYKFGEMLLRIKETKQLICHPSKFILLSWQGLLNVYDYDIVIINCEIKSELTHAFRLFYIDGKLYDLTKPSCIVFTDDKNIDLPIYFQSTQSNKINTQKNNIKCLTLDLTLTDEIVSYAKCRRILKSTVKKVQNPVYLALMKKLEKLEKEDLDEATVLLNKCINFNKTKNIAIEQEDKEKAKKLLEHRQMLEIIKGIKNMGPIFIKGDFKCELDNVYNYNEMSANDIDPDASLILIEEADDEDVHKFKNVIIIKKEGDFPNLVVDEICKNKELTIFHKYAHKKRLEYCTTSPNKYPVPTLALDYAVIFSEHVMYMINRLFYDNFLLLKDLRVYKSFYSAAQENKFYCCLELPKMVDGDFFSKKIQSDNFSLKKDAYKDVCYKFLIKMYEAGFLDANFLPVKQKFIDENQVYIENIKKIYNIDFQDLEEAKQLINAQKEAYEFEDRFFKEHSICFDEENVSVLNINEVLRKQPRALSKFTDTMSVYIFNKSNIGICTGKSFRNTVSYKETEINYLKEVNFTENEKKVILNFQIFFFSINFRRKTFPPESYRKYAYYVIPIKSGNIDFDYMNLMCNKFFFGSVYEVKDKNILSSFLLFNPINKQFYEYVNESEKKLTDEIGTICKRIRSVNGNPPSPETTFLEYFNEKYGLELEKQIDDTNIIFGASIYSAKKGSTYELNSGEIFHVSAISKNIKNDYKKFVKFFNVFETMALVHELKEKMNLEVSLENLAISFTQRGVYDGEFDLGYERLEFIGDSVLKYAVSKYLFIECGYNLNKLVTTKDYIVCNDNLYRIAKKIGLSEYFTFNKYSEHLFQPPAILSELEDHSLVQNLGAEFVFTNSNQANFVKNFSIKHTKDSLYELGNKVLADIVESMIGAHYIELGFDKAFDFIKKLGILDRHTKTLSYRKMSETKESIYLLCEYEGILPYQNVQMIEEKINYKFKNKGYLEKAMIHPSFKDNMFGSERFQKLELIGDCFLDLNVSDYIFYKYPEADPEALHTYRKGLVNNNTFARILLNEGLFDLALTGLHEDTRDKKSKISKCYSDIFESLIGAVVLDSDFDLEKTKQFFSVMLKFMIVNTFEC
ncbi:dicer-like protein [Vairimorpha necatrix]|uniref:Dicer-like protein n=1 Tax=Vairimorpha necatrix TaxID=6039 RepID=A0AAX4J8B4_9MICR